MEVLGELEKNLDVEDAICGVDTLQALLRWKKTQTELGGFLRPLQTACQAFGDGRVHAELNLNTATGRLSTRNPNLQGEPTCGDVRDLLSAKPGRCLLMADYSQLELRLVAHLANCQPMMDILKAGGDIHSRTAYNMFDEVRKAVDEGTVLLDSTCETCETERQDSLPLVKDEFPEFRKKAKTLNFSLLYGKTSFALAKDWNVTEAEAQEVIDRWFAVFPEVRQWLDKAEGHTRQPGCEV